MSSYQYRKSLCGDKMVVRSSYLHYGNSYTGKMSSLCWISPLGIVVAQAVGQAARQTAQLALSHTQFSQIIFKLGKNIHWSLIFDELDYVGSDPIMSWSIMGFIITTKFWGFFANPFHIFQVHTLKITASSLTSMIFFGSFSNVAKTFIVLRS